MAASETSFSRITCITDSRSASTPIPENNTETGTDPVEPTPEEKVGMQGSGSKFYTELWFIILMAAVGLILLAIFLGLLLHKALNKPPFTRERPPLVPLPLQKRSPMAVYPPSNSYMFDTVPDTSNSSSSVTLKGFTMHLEGVVENKNVDSAIPHDREHSTHGVSVLHVTSHGLSENPLHRSVSQLIDTHSRKSLTDDGVWDSIMHGYGPGMYMEDEEFIDTIKGFSTVRKEHTMFTDTNL